MPRRVRRPDPPPARPATGAGIPELVDLGPDPVGPSGVVEVRRIAGARATKPYRCPGCDHEVAVGVAHVVVIPRDDPGARRHWHGGCWERERRRRRV
jgi:hypothetical protein